MVMYDIAQVVSLEMEGRLSIKLIDRLEVSGKFSKGSGKLCAATASHKSNIIYKRLLFSPPILDNSLCIESTSNVNVYKFFLPSSDGSLHIAKGHERF